MTNKEAIEELKAKVNLAKELEDEEVNFISIEALDLAIKALEERPQGDIRWTDKLSVKSNGDIIDFEGRVVGHIDLEDMKGGAE